MRQFVGEFSVTTKKLRLLIPSNQFLNKLPKEDEERIRKQYGGYLIDRPLYAFLQREQNVAEALKRDYVVVMIDVNNGHNRSICLKYGQPHFLPTIIVVEDDGKMLTASNPEKWNEGHRYSPEKVLAFLNEWAPRK